MNAATTSKNHEPTKKIAKYLDTYTADLYYEDISGIRYYVTSLEDDNDGWFYALYATKPGNPFVTDRQYFHTAEGLAVNMRSISGDMRKWRVVKY